ncbi:MAG TPA: nitroreductase family protein [Bacteroidales bacterium]|nr:nitroreductase family protein [Bacteroidales bacterium]
MVKEIFEHRSIRKYKPDSIPSEIMQSVLEAASRAATTGNMQVYSIVVTTDPSIKEQLAPCHFNQPMVKQAPVVLTFCADFNRFMQWCSLRNADAGAYNNFLSFVTAAIDALLAAQNACLEAESHGLGTCYLGTTTYTAGKIIDILKLPKGVVPVTTLVLGYPSEIPPLTDRLPLRAVVHYETYHDFTDEEIEALYREKENRSDSRQFVAENNKQNLAQVFTDIRYTRKDNTAFSAALLEVLKNQGYM